jgi:hypothetical protein
MESRKEMKTTLRHNRALALDTLKESRTMIANRILNLTLALSLAATATGCGAVAYARIEQESAPTPMPVVELTRRVPAATLEQVVESFYDWYLGYASPIDGRNPLVDGAYRDRPELAPELVAEMDALLGGLEGFHYDPFLMAQDVPTGYEISLVTYEGESVTVVLATSFEGHQLAVSMVRSGDGWQIRNITRPNVESATQAPQAGDALAAAAQQTVKFYDWYLGYIRSGEDGPRSILHNGAYQTCGFFTPSYIEELDAMLASDEPLMADPFLCAQDIPDSVTVEQAVEVAPGVQVTMSSSFEGHTFNVFLREMAPCDWQIDGVQPAVR